MIVSVVLAEAVKRLKESGVIEPRLEAASLLAFALGRDRTFLFAHPEYQLTRDENRRFASILGRRADREPFQYIVGKQEFYGFDFRLSPDVLIPRPETGILVENAIKLLDSIDCPRFLEIGVGSGCISISVLKNVASAAAVGVDISERSLAVAKNNAQLHGVADRLNLSISDIYDSVERESFDAILSNPPYIPAADLAALQPEVRNFEPSAALTDGGDGLSIIREIVREAPERLTRGGYLIIEFGFGQAESVLSMFDREIWRSVTLVNDMQGIPRTAVAAIR